MVAAERGAGFKPEPQVKTVAQSQLFLYGLTRPVVKRLFDIFWATVGLLLLWPLFLFLAAWIKWDSVGPALYLQQRVGRYGEPFLIHKFRTMRHAADQLGPQITVAHDPRITRAGQFLRRSKLDELPQLWDVWRGRMSLVGPRPEVPSFVAMYPAAVRDKVLSVRPGITDLASLEFRHESDVLAQALDPHAQYLEVVMPRKLDYAMRYVDEASLWLDVKVIALTIWAIWTR
jgi:lipopolysaccharide/colanic/teichoic acid biosynthesis glycosyltransferase